MDNLSTVSVTELKGVGAALAEKLHKLHIETLQDLLFHLPIRYQDRTRVLPIGRLNFGDEAVVEGHVISCDVQMGKRRSLVCRIRDDSGSLCLRFFHFNASQRKQLEPGKQVRCFGEVRRGSTGFERRFINTYIPFNRRVNTK